MTDELDEGQTAAPEPPAKPKKAASVDGTGYIVLVCEKVHNEAPATWQIVGENLTARNAEQAVKEYAKATDLTVPLRLVAVPARSWRPLTVTPKTTTSLVIEEAS